MTGTRVAPAPKSQRRKIATAAIITGVSVAAISAWVVLVPRGPQAPAPKPPVASAAPSPAATVVERRTVPVGPDGREVIGSWDAKSVTVIKEGEIYVLLDGNAGNLTVRMADAPIWPGDRITITRATPAPIASSKPTTTRRS